MKKVIVIILVIAAIALLAFGLYVNYQDKQADVPQTEKLYWAIVSNQLKMRNELPFRIF